MEKGLQPTFAAHDCGMSLGQRNLIPLLIEYLDPFQPAGVGRSRPK